MQLDILRHNIQYLKKQVRKNWEVVIGVVAYIITFITLVITVSVKALPVEKQDKWSDFGHSMMNLYILFLITMISAIVSLIGPGITTLYFLAKEYTIKFTTVKLYDREDV